VKETFRWYNFCEEIMEAESGIKSYAGSRWLLILSLGLIAPILLGACSGMRNLETVPGPPEASHLISISQDSTYYTDRIIVVFNKDAVLPEEVLTNSSYSLPSSLLFQNDVPAVLARYIADSFSISLEYESYIGEFNFASYKCVSPAQAESLIRNLPRLYPKSVKYVEFDGKAKLAYVPNDPDYPDSLWGMEKINPEPAWDVSTGLGVRIAIVDTGIRYSGNQANSVPDHEDLADHVLNPPDNWPNETFDLAEGDNIPNDEDGHGTHVAGTAAAVGDNGTGVVGVAFNAQIIPIKVLDGNETELPYSRLIQAISLAQVADADVINMSLVGKYLSKALHEAIQQAFSSGIVLVASAGNYGNDKRIYPAAYPEVISVGATTPSDARTSFSNFGEWVDIAAPGVGIRSTWNSSPSAYWELNGTSMASPHVAGAAGLLLSYQPSLSPEEIRAILVASGVALPDSDWENPDVTRLDVGNAISYSLGQPPSVQLTSPAPGEVSGVVSVTADASDNDGSVLKVLFYAGDYFLAVDRSEPFSVLWDTTKYPNTTYELRAVAFDDQMQQAVDTIQVTVNNPQISPDYYEDFESGSSGWWIRDDSGNAYWHLVADRYLSPTHSFAFVNASGSYDNLEFDLLFSPVFDLTGLQHVKATFYHLPQFGSGDKGMVAVNIGDGEYHVLRTFSEYETNENNWHFAEVSLDDYIGNSAQVVFIAVSDDDLVVGNGWWIDDFTLKKSSAPPEITITSPQNGETLSGTVKFSAEANDDVLISKVEFYVGDELVFTDMTAPYEFDLDTTYVHGGYQVLKAVAYDEYPLTAQDSITVIVKNHELTSFFPQKTTSGSIITVNGSLFVANGDDTYNPDTDELLFTGENGTLSAEVATWTQTLIKAYVPQDAIDGPIAVDIGGAVVTSTSDFKILPLIDALVPNSARVGDTIEINGSGFQPEATGSSKVLFGELQAPEIVSWSNRSIQVKVPVGVQPSLVKVQTENGLSNGIFFTPLPKITSLSRYRGHPGSALTIYGSNFGAGGDSSWVVFFPGITVSGDEIDVWQDAVIVLNVPQGAESGPMYVVADGNESNHVDFVVTLPPPVLEGLSQY